MRAASERWAAASVRVYARLRLEVSASRRPLTVRWGWYSASGRAVSVTTTSTPLALVDRAGAAAGRATSRTAAATRPRFRTEMVGAARSAPDPGPSGIVADSGNAHDR